MSLTTDLGHDLARSFSSLRLPYSLVMMASCLLGTLLLFAGLAIGVYHLILAQDWLHTPWLEQLAGYGGAGALLVLGWFLFPAVSTALAGLFVEQLADRIEQQQYQGLPRARPVGLEEQIRTGLSALRRTTGLNLLVSPLYLVPGLNILIYLSVNARLLAGEYFDALALRHIAAGALTPLRHELKWPLFFRGLVIAGLYITPILNLLAPVLATALMTHYFWGPSGPLRLRLALGPSNVLPTQPNGAQKVGAG